MICRPVPRRSPDLAKRKLAEAESEGVRRAGYSTSGSPANISVSRTVQLAMARRIALATTGAAASISMMPRP
jgi:uncharacterized sporulation protein YeaH/YhbH (DUF444 family)